MWMGGTNRNGEDRNAGIGRRRLLAAAGLLIAGGIGGCVATGPFRKTTLSVGIREPFETKLPLTVPLSIDATVQNVNEKHVALREVELALLDDSRNLLAVRELGDFSRQAAPPANRESQKYDGYIGSNTAYRAEWELEADVQMASVPTWVTFRVEALEFDEPDGTEAEASLLIGRARATQPPPEFSATALRLESDADDSRKLNPEDYRPQYFEGSHLVDKEGTLLPREEQTTTETTSSPSPK